MLPTAPRKEYAPGDVIIDKYRLLQLLGEGGMGSVWVAENTALKANIALKLIRADVAEASANDRFLSEARLAARLQHAAIVRVFDFGKTQNGEPFIVMELLEGETLGQRLTRLGSIDPVELCQTLLPIIDALHSAHGHGVIHRDLKPDNVFIAKAEGGGVQPKLLDFGIAKLRGEGSFQTTKLTQAGTLIGSPDYMSPEQARGETDLDPRSDVWALCVLAYECLVGKPPFHGDNYNALLWSIIHDEPVPITVFQAGDSELWRLLKKGFSKDRNGRWESARKLGEALALWLENHGVVEDVCNRSLHASWLPAERPTQPELAPFDQNAPPPMARSSSSPAMVPPPTLPSLRRPHRLSMWFAMAGFATLALALFRHSTGEDDTSLMVESKPADTRQQKGALKPDGIAAVEPRRTAQPSSRPYVPEATAEGTTAPSGRPDFAPDSRVNEVADVRETAGQESPAVEGTAAARPATEARAPLPTPKPAPSAGASASGAQATGTRPAGTQPAGAAPSAAAAPPKPVATPQPVATRPKPTHPQSAPVPPRKKVEADKSEAEFDFGI
jgi:eukaryotic-like serine/threonine-protein kinase